MTAESQSGEPHFKPRSTNPDALSERRLMVSSAKTAGWFELLPQDEQRALDDLFQGDRMPSISEVGYHQGRTREWIRRLEKRGIEKLGRLLTLPYGDSVAEQEYLIKEALGNKFNPIEQTFGPDTFWVMHSLYIDWHLPAENIAEMLSTTESMVYQTLKREGIARRAPGRGNSRRRLTQAILDSSQE